MDVYGCRSDGPATVLFAMLSADRLRGWAVGGTAVDVAASCCCCCCCGLRNWDAMSVGLRRSKKSRMLNALLGTGEGELRVAACDGVA